MSKRGPSLSSALALPSKRVKAESSDDWSVPPPTSAACVRGNLDTRLATVKREEGDVKPVLAEDPSSSAPSRSTTSLNKLPADFLVHTSKHELGRLLVQAASLSMDFNIILSDRVRDPIDFLPLVGEAVAKELSADMVPYLDRVTEALAETSLTQTKVNALCALYTIITYVA